LRWPAKRFERFYKAFVQRKLAEELKQRKLDMINAIHSNPNMDGDKIDKPEETRKIEEAFDEAIESIYRDGPVEPEIDKSNPFWGAIDRGLEWIDNPDAQRKLDAASERAPSDPNEFHRSEAEIDQ